MKKAIKDGIKNGFKVCWDLAKIIIPIIFIVNILKNTVLFEKTAEYLSPVMGALGLPGGAALVLLIGSTLNLYAAIGAMIPLNMDQGQITIIAFMLLVAHTLPIEVGVLRKIKVNYIGMLFLRISTAFAIGFLLNIFI